MSIEVACTCGRTVTVRDELAGKRGRCPECQSVIQIPRPLASVEEDAYQLLHDPSDDRQPARAASSDADHDVPRTAAGPSGPAARSSPPRGKKPEYRYDEESRDERSGLTITPGVLAGLGIMLLAVVWFVVGYQAGRIFFYPPILFFLGLGKLINALRGHEA